jgi:PAS domain S-box-containing protein
METATDYAIITMDTERKIERWSNGATQIFRFTEAEVIGQSADIIFTPEDLEAGAPQQEMETARDTGRAADERWHQRKDGSRFFASGVMRSIQENALTGYVKVLRDVTQQRLFTEELSKQVKERTIELRRSNEDLQQFAHVASHDLKEPVRKIKTFHNRIRDEYGKTLPEQVSFFLEKINSSTDRMYTMIDGILSYSKLANAKQSFKGVDLNEIIRNIEIDLEVLIQQKNAVITATEMRSLTADNQLMYQLFYNLILNSLKFSKEGEPVRINITSEDVEHNQSRFNKITLSDNGIGFEQEYADSIFETFTRLNPVEEYEGTGLGLALCKKIVERHEGSISATSEPGKGATFIIFLPHL